MPISKFYLFMWRGTRTIHRQIPSIEHPPITCVFQSQSWEVQFHLVRSNRSTNVVYIITLFISITMLCGTVNILQNIPHIQHEWWNITKIIVKLNHTTLLWMWIMLWLSSLIIHNISLFISITMLRGTDNILQNIPIYFSRSYRMWKICENIPWDIASHTERCYGYEKCYQYYHCLDYMASSINVFVCISCPTIVIYRWSKLYSKFCWLVKILLAIAIANYSFLVC